MFPCRHGTYKEIILAATQKDFKSENIHKDSLIPHIEIIKKMIQIGTVAVNLERRKEEF